MNTGFFQSPSLWQPTAGLPVTMDGYEQQHILAAQLSSAPLRLRLMQTASGTLTQVYTISSNIIDSQQQLVRHHLGSAWHLLPSALTVGMPSMCVCTACSRLCPLLTKAESCWQGCCFLVRMYKMNRPTDAHIVVCSGSPGSPAVAADPVSVLEACTNSKTLVAASEPSS